MINGNVLERYEVNIEGIRPLVIDSIVKVYGEKYRSQIEDRLNNVYINSYVTADGIKRDYYFIKSHFLDMLSVEFLRKIGVEVSKEIEDKVYQNGVYNLTDEQKETLKTYFQSTQISENGPIYSFNDELLLSENTYVRNKAINDRCDILRKMGLDINEDNYEEVIATQAGKDAMQKVKAIYNVAIECNQEYTLFKSQNRDYDEYLNKVDDYSRRLNLDYLKMYANSILPFCDEDTKKNINLALKMDLNSTYDFVRMADKNGMYLVTYGTPMMLAFSKQAEDVIQEGSFTANGIKEARIKYFKSKGLDLGDEYEKYQDSEEAEKLLPDPEIVEELTRISNELNKQKDREFFLNTGNYAICKENLLALGLHIQESFSKELVESNSICTVPNVVKDENGNYRLFNVVHLPLSAMLPNYRDVDVIHELLHVVESNMEQVSDEEFHFKYGFDYCTEKLCDGAIVDDDLQQEDSGHRENELFSENLHQELAIRVAEDLHSKGIFLFDDPKTAKERNGTSYESYNVITASFQNKFMENIIDGMMQPTMEPLTNVVGDNNFKRLNDCVNEYAKIPYYVMMDDVINKRDTKFTRQRQELISRGMEIAADMQKHRDGEYHIETQLIGKNTVHQSTKGKTMALESIRRDINRVLEGEQTKDE